MKIIYKRRGSRITKSFERKRCTSTPEKKGRKKKKERRKDTWQKAIKKGATESQGEREGGAVVEGEGRTRRLGQDLPNWVRTSHFPPRGGFTGETLTEQQGRHQGLLTTVGRRGGGRIEGEVLSREDRRRQAENLTCDTFKDPYYPSGVEPGSTNTRGADFKSGKIPYAKKKKTSTARFRVSPSTIP